MSAEPTFHLQEMIAEGQWRQASRSMSANDMRPLVRTLYLRTKKCRVISEDRMEEVNFSKYEKVWSDMTITPAVIRMLRAMADAEDAEEYEDSEAVRDRFEVWVGSQTFAARTLSKAINIMAVKDISDGSGISRFAINDVGRAILLNPKVSDEVLRMVYSGTNFTISDGKVVKI